MLLLNNFREFQTKMSNLPIVLCFPNLVRSNLSSTKIKFPWNCSSKDNRYSVSGFDQESSSSCTVFQCPSSISGILKSTSYFRNQASPCPFSDFRQLEICGFVCCREGSLENIILRKAHFCWVGLPRMLQVSNFRELNQGVLLFL